MWLHNYMCTCKCQPILFLKWISKVLKFETLVDNDGKTPWFRRFWALVNFRFTHTLMFEWSISRSDGNTLYSHQSFLQAQGLVHLPWHLISTASDHWCLYHPHQDCMHSSECWGSFLPPSEGTCCVAPQKKLRLISRRWFWPKTVVLCLSKGGKDGGRRMEVGRYSRKGMRVKGRRKEGGKEEGIEEGRKGGRKGGKEKGRKRGR